jgi:O-antigen/teichoic acid export membrane protein
MELLTETVTEAPGAPALKIGGKVLARNTVLNFAGGAAPVLLALVTIPYVIRGIGVDRFGVLSLALVTVGYLCIVDLGLGRAMTKFVAETLGKGKERSNACRRWSGPH